MLQRLRARCMPQDDLEQIALRAFRVLHPLSLLSQINQATVIHIFTKISVSQSKHFKRVDGISRNKLFKDGNGWNRATLCSVLKKHLGNADIISLNTVAADFKTSEY